MSVCLCLSVNYNNLESPDTPLWHTIPIWIIMEFTPVQ